MDNFWTIILEYIIMIAPLVICGITHTDNNFFLMPSLVWATAWYPIIMFSYKNKVKPDMEL